MSHHVDNNMERLHKPIAAAEQKFLKTIKDILKPLPWFQNAVITGSMAYGTALKGSSDLDIQVNYYFELSTIEFQLVPP